MQIEYNDDIKEFYSARCQLDAKTNFYNDSVRIDAF